MLQLIENLFQDLNYIPKKALGEFLTYVLCGISRTYDGNLSKCLLYSNNGSGGVTLGYTVEKSNNDRYQP